MNYIKKVSSVLLVFSVLFGILATGLFIPTWAIDIDPRVERAVQLAVSIANDDSHGYSQARRQGPDYDCSSLVYYCFSTSGFSFSSSWFWTGNMGRALIKAGFREITDFDFSSSGQLVRGDILWKEGHTEIYIGNNKKVGAHSDWGYPALGDQTRTEISVDDYSSNSGWTKLYRYSSEPIPLTVSWLTYSDKHQIGETNAILAKRADIIGASNSDVTKIGIYLYDTNDMLLSSFSEKPAVTGNVDPYVLMWYDVNLSTELNYKLTPNTKYKYRMFVVVNGKTFYSQLESFKTLGSAVSVNWSVFNEKNEIGETNAVLAKRADITGANNNDVTKIGIYLYDANDKLLSSFSEKPSVTGTANPYVLMWYDVNLSTELNYKLTHNTTYKYKMFVVVKGETYYSSLETFKTNEGTHSYGAWQTEKAATCTADGSKKAFCVCGASKTETIPATGHSWNSGIVTTVATCVSTGVKTYTCTACKTTKTETIAKDPSKHTGGTEIRNAVEATLEHDGYTGDVYCNGCGAKLERGKDIPKPAPEYIPGDINNDGNVNNKDLTRLMKYLAGEDVEVVEKALDVNGDGVVNNKDLTRLLKYLSGEIIKIL